MQDLPGMISQAGNIVLLWHYCAALAKHISKRGQHIYCKLKADTDDIITRCSQLQNLRECIIAEQGKETKDNSRAQDYLERYFKCIVLLHYLRSNMETEFEVTWVDWIAEEPQQELMSILGTREEGPLSIFNFT